MINRPSITDTELIKKLLDRNKGAMPITFEAFTTVKAKKTDNPYDSIHKLTTVNGFTGHVYEDSVNRQLKREEKPTNFVESERKWGENLNNILTKKGDSYYLRVRPINTSKPQYFVRQDEELKQVEKSQVERWLPKTYTPQNQGTDKEIVHREYLLTNIRSITFDGNTWDIIHHSV